MINPQHHEGDSSPHGWTLDTLEEYLTSKIVSVEKYFTDITNEREAASKERSNASKEAVTAALIAAKEAVTAAMAASEKAILKAENASDKRSEASNEIRAAMLDQQKNFPDKNTTEYRFGAVEQRLSENVTALSKRLDGIDNALALAGGKSQGVGMTAGFIVQLIASIASIGAIIGVIMIFLRHG